jgi:aminopeptidase C
VRIFFGGIKFLVTNTIPNGIVKVTNDTKITFAENVEIAKTEEDLPYGRIINVKSLPNLKEMLEVKSLNEIAKLAEHYFINKYEDEKSVVYFVGNWYFRVKKKSKKA